MAAELLLIVFTLLLIALLTTSALAALSGRWRLAKSLLLACGVAVAIYLGGVGLASFLMPQQVLAIGDDWCFDDWCVAVDNVTLTPELGPEDHRVQADGVFYVVGLRLSNHARGRPQRASSAKVYLLDGQGNQITISEAGQLAYETEAGPSLPLTVTIPLRQSVNTVRVFDVPIETSQVGLTIQHPVGFTPGLFVIGDQASLWHQPTIIRLR